MFNSIKLQISKEFQRFDDSNGKNKSSRLTLKLIELITKTKG
jgi:hypothetical protein